MSPIGPTTSVCHLGHTWIFHSLALGILMLGVLALNSQHRRGRLASCLTSGEGITQVQPEGVKMEIRESSLKSHFFKIWLNNFISPTFIYQGSHVSLRMKWKFLAHKDWHDLDPNTSLHSPHSPPPQHTPTSPAKISPLNL